MRHRVVRGLLVVLLASGVLALPAAAADPPQHDAPGPIPAGADFATERFSDPWDYHNVDDILIDVNGPTMGAANTRMEGGRLIWDATSSGYISPLWPGYPAALPTWREGAINPIDANRYTHASFQLYAARQTPAALMWFAGCRDFVDNCLGGVSFMAQEGWNTYNIPLVNSFPGLPQEWQGPVFGLRLAFSTDTATRFELDWFRVYQPGQDVRLSWTNPGGGPATLRWQREAAPGYNQTSGVVASINGGSGTTTFPASAYPPGTYRFLVESGGQQSPASEPLVIAAPPLPTVIAPDAAGAEDWAVRHTGRGWEFTDPSDAADLGNVQNVAWLGNALAANNGPPQMDDPHVVLRQPGPIDPDRYHRITVRMTYEGEFNLAFAAGGGTHGRLLWRRDDRGDQWIDSRPIVTYTTIDTYTWSMKTDPPGRVSETDVPWTGAPVTSVRWDPNEDEGPRRWTLHEVSLRADHETSGGFFHIRWRDGNHQPGATATIAAHAGSPTGPATTIATGVPQEAGENTYRWDASGLSHGRYWVSVAVNAGVASNRAVSSGPVVVHGEGAPPDLPPDISAACPEGQVPSAGFADVPSGNPHARAVDCVAWWEVALGVAPGSYAPSRTVTRGQMATFVARMIEATGQRLEAGETQFTDIAGHTHEEGIRQLATAGVVAGTTATTYSPNDPVTRAQMATFLVRAYELSSGEQLGATRSHFGDIAGNPHEANINAAAEAGFTTGTAPGVYSPLPSVRRDQMGSFIARTLNRLVVRGHADLPS